LAVGVGDDLHRPVSDPPSTSVRKTAAWARVIAGVLSLVAGWCSFWLLASWGKPVNDEDATGKLFVGLALLLSLGALGVAVRGPVRVSAALTLVATGCMAFGFAYAFPDLR
jgi:hypothetical protein